MAIDGFTLYCMLPEMDAALRGRAVRDVVQHTRTEVVLRFRSREGEPEAALLLSAHAVHARAHLVTRFPKQRESERPHFASVLVKHLMRARLTGVEQAGLDRILTFRFELDSQVPGAEPERRDLVVEMMGKHSNIILTNPETGRVIEPLTHVDERVNRYREVLPGVAYVPPPPSRRSDPFGETPEGLAERIDPRETPVSRQIVRAYDGFGSATAAHVCETARDETDAAELWHAFRTTVVRIRSHDVEPCVIWEERNREPTAYSLFLPNAADTRHERTDSVSRAVGRAYVGIERQDQLAGLRHTIAQALDRRERSLARKIADLTVELSAAEKASEYRVYGDLLLASLDRIEPRAETASVPNYFEPDAPIVQIPLESDKNAAENAQAYFRRYQKAKRGAAIIRQHVFDTEQELEWVEEKRVALESADSLEAATELHAQLIELGWVADPDRSRRREKRKADTPYRLVTTANGWQILIGRNDRENEWLVTRAARKDDIWLHAKQIPGSHVIVRNPERKTQIPMPVLLEAAGLAAYFSKGRTSNRVPVDYTFAKYVVRPKGTAAGFVTYTHEKTLYVEPAATDRRFAD